MWNLPNQRANLCPLHWQADSYPLHHLGSPLLAISIAPESSIVMPEAVVKLVPSPQVVQPSRRESSRGRYSKSPPWTGLLGALLVRESLGGPQEPELGVLLCLR